jgi:acyl carrier protein
MTTVLAERMAQIKRMACDAFEIDSDELTETSQFDEDLGIDSLNLIDLLAALEKHFRIEIDREGLTRMVNLKGVYEVVTEALEPSAEPDDVRATR